MHQKHIWYRHRQIRDFSTARGTGSALDSSMNSCNNPKVMSFYSNCCAPKRRANQSCIAPGVRHRKSNTMPFRTALNYPGGIPERENRSSRPNRVSLVARSFEVELAIETWSSGTRSYLERGWYAGANNVVLFCEYGIRRWSKMRLGRELWREALEPDSPRPGRSDPSEV